MSDLLSGFDEATLLSQFPPSVMLAIEASDKQKISWDNVGTLLAAAPSAGIALKGGGRWTGSLWLGVKKEFHSFLCTDSAAYADLRREWNNLRKKSSTLAVASLSGVIGAQLGVASGVVAPLVIWALIVALRIGHKALCEAISESGAAPTG